MIQSQLIKKFVNIFGESFSKELLSEFEKAKSYNWLGDVTKTLLHSARFCEICVVCLKHFSKPSEIFDLNKIEFAKYSNDLLQLPKSSAKEEILFLVIPQALKTIYSIRSKKRVAHIKITNADLIDSEFVITSCNWVMSQLIIIFFNIPFEEAVILTNSIMERKIPTIEQFEDGEIMILKKGLILNEELLLLLYQYPKRITRTELNLILRPKKSSYISTYLNRLYDDKLIHLNNEGAIINKNGIKEIEDNKEKYFI